MKLGSNLSLAASMLVLGLALPCASNAAEETEELSEVIVTGTAIRGVAPVGSATITVGIEEILESGAHDASTLTTLLPQGSGLGTTLQSNGGRSAGVNLRGLGNNATLIMFDGHRPVLTGIQNVLPDPNMIPFGALDRVEVVSDGASAIYGSDAVAGVVNYIFKRPSNGGTIAARYTHTLYNQVGVDASWGKTWSGGGFLAAMTWERNTSVPLSDVPWLRQDLRQYGGADNRLVGTTFASVGPCGGLIQGNTVYGLPCGLNGRTPTTAEVNALRGTPQLIDRSENEDYYTRRRRAGVQLRLVQNIGPGELTLTGMYNRRDNVARGQGDGGFQSIAVAIPTNSPYYVAGLTGGGSQSIVYNFRANNPDRELNRHDHENDTNIFFEYRTPLRGDFGLTLSGGWGMSNGCAVCQPQANTILTSVIAQPANASQFNPYVSGPQASAERIFGIFFQNGQQKILNFAPKIDGSLFEISGRMARIALGAEITRYDFWQESDYSLNVNGVSGSTLPTTSHVVFRYADTNRTVASGFTELFLPVLSRLDLSVAARYDHYSDFGSTTNPKFGLTWRATDDLKLRGSWGTSFRAPTLSETNFNVVGAANRTNVVNGLNDPTIPITVASSGQTAILVSAFRFTPIGPEKAKIYSFGADYTPSFVSGLTLNATYYSVDYKDQISGLPNSGNALRTPADFAIYSPFFIRAPQPTTCVNGSVNGNPGTPEYATYNPLYLKYLNAPGSYPPTTINDCQLQGILDTSTKNLGRVKQSGVDLAASYKTDLPFASLSLNGAFTKILSIKRNLIPGTPLVDALDVIGEQIGKRGRFAARLARGAWSGSVAANYIGGYLNNNTPTISGVKLPNQNVPSWTTLDLTATYNSKAASGFLQGARVELNVRNFTDKDPPTVLTATPTAMDNAVHNAFGRILTIEVAKSFGK